MPPVELIGCHLPSRFPFYYELKILMLLWLISPVSRGSLGSSILYRKFIHPILMRKEEVSTLGASLPKLGYCRM